MTSRDDTPDYDDLAARELAAFRNREGTSAPIGAIVVNWYRLSDPNARAAWVALREWVEWFTVRYNIPISVVPNCWWRHGALVEELSALHTLHTAAFDSTDSGYGPNSWHEHWNLAQPRLTRGYGGGCNNGHQPTKPRTWSSATDEQEWDAWTTQAHAHRDTPVSPERKETQ